MMDLIGALTLLAALLVCIIPHEVAHGYIAWRMGDPTAKAAGRLTLNPLPHIDPIGSVLLPMTMLVLNVVTGFGLIFGWAKPVPVNPYLFRDPERGMLWVSLAGPGTNFAMALVAAGLGRGLIALGLTAGWPLFFLAYVVLLSLVLALFNLVPVPPLDGSRVLAYFLPPQWRRSMAQLEPYGMFIVMALLFLGVLGVVFRVAQSLWVELAGFDWLRLAGFFR